MVVQLPQDHAQVAVYFRLPATIWAGTVHLVGDFNGWSANATPMRLGEQYWEARLVLPVGSQYTYAYLLDGADWCADTPAQERAVGERPLVTMLPIPISQAQRHMSVA